MIRRFWWLFGFIRHVTYRFINDRCLQTAAALTYTSLLSLVPLLTVGFSILSAFPVFKSLGEDVQDFIFTNFVPASQEMIQNYLLRFAEQASQLTTMGIIFLLVTALLLMKTIDEALNDIWEVSERREGISVFIVYWAVLSLGPLLIGISLAVTSYVVSLPLISDVAQNPTVAQLRLLIMPFLLTTVAFTLIYVVIPNRPVRLRHSFIGGLLAALLFEIAKKAFAFYVTQFATYELVYGTLAAIPIFLLWIYVSWLIILLGAEVTRSLVSFHWRKDKLLAQLPANGLLHAFRLIGHLWHAQHQGYTLSLKQLQQLEPQFSDIRMDVLLSHLEEYHWLHRTLEGHYALSRDIHEVSLLTLYQTLSGLLLSTAEHFDSDPWNQAFDQIISETRQALETTLQVPLAQLYTSQLPNCAQN
ncbi:MAG: virulence factor BrkB family protein [Pseudomonadota bacterium]|nr:virulence factor BrkB family protein [Pseudomonadota bacterium]